MSASKLQKFQKVVAASTSQLILHQYYSPSFPVMEELCSTSHLLASKTRTSPHGRLLPLVTGLCRGLAALPSPGSKVGLPAYIKIKPCQSKERDLLPIRRNHLARSRSKAGIPAYTKTSS